MKRRLQLCALLGSVAVACSPSEDSNGPPTDDTNADESTSVAETGGQTEESTGGSETGTTGSTNPDWADPTWRKIEFRFQQYEVPAAETTYTCQGFVLSSDQVRHMVAFDPVVDAAAVVHHMVVYRMENPYPEDYRPCFDMPQTSEVTWAWAPGGDRLILPDEAGFPFADTGGSSYYAFQIHYNNPLLEEGHVDNSGVDIYVAEELREHHAGGLALGILGDIDIPPGEPAWEQSATCTLNFLQEPIHVFANMVHAHELGRQIWTDHMRDGEKIGEAGRDDEYDFNDQGFTPQEIVVEPGDEMVTHCVWDSTERDSNTGFGLETADEMCFNYLMHYPKVTLPFCF